MTESTWPSKPIKRRTLAETLAQQIEDSIISGRLAGGDALPTEPELAKQFGVSRAVVRDATRLLLARGLVDVQHGRGVFVTGSGEEAFGDALLLALRRAGATAWDVEQFEELLLPQVIALAASAATNEEIDAIRAHVDAYVTEFERLTVETMNDGTPPEGWDALLGDFLEMMKAVFAATHNRVLEQLAAPLLSLRRHREWEETLTPEESARLEAAYLHNLVDAIASRDPEAAAQRVRRGMALPTEAVDAMKATPIGEIPRIRASRRDLFRDLLTLDS